MIVNVYYCDEKTGSNGKVTVEQGADGEKKFRMSQKHESHRRTGIAAG